MAGHQEVEELAKRGQGDLLVRDRGRELLDEEGCVSRGDLAKLDAACVAPLEEADHVPAVGPACVGITEPRGEKFFRREASTGSASFHKAASPAPDRNEGKAGFTHSSL